MRRYAILLGIGIILWPTIGQPAAAASFTPGERERQDAIAVGRRSVVSEEFGAEWRGPEAPRATPLVVKPLSPPAPPAPHTPLQSGALKTHDNDKTVKESGGTP